MAIDLKSIDGTPIINNPNIFSPTTSEPEKVNQLSAVTGAISNVGSNIATALTPRNPFDFGYVPGASLTAHSTPTGVPNPVLPEVKTPAPVISTNTAEKQITEKYQPTLDQAKLDLQKQADANKLKAEQEQAKIDAEKAKVPPPTPEKTPEQMVAEQPAPGYHYVYKSDGSKVEVSANITASQLGEGYYDTDPTKEPTKPVIDSVQDQYGNVYKKYDDGTIGKYDQTMKYLGPATETSYTDAKNIRGVIQDIDSVLNGSYPLKPWQTAQLDSLKKSYERTIAEQEVVNQNKEGWMTVAQNLYGLGNTQVGKDAITTVIQNGMKEVRTLQDEMAGAVAKMEAGFQTDNYKMLQEAYNMYTDSQERLQNKFDQIMTDKNKAKETQDAVTNNVNLAIDNDIRELIKDASKNGLSPEQMVVMQKALKEHDYVGAIKAAGDTLKTTTGVIGQYNLYKSEGGTLSFEQWYPQYSKKATATTMNNNPGAGSAAVNAATMLNIKDTTVPLYTVVSSPENLTKLVNAIISNEGGSPQYVLNNPGNIKYYAGLANAKDSGVKATDGGTFASFTSADAGIQAIKDIILGAASGKSSAYGPNPTFESFMNTYTNTHPEKASYAQVGLLSQTDYNPNDEVDKLAKVYLDRFIQTSATPRPYDIVIPRTSIGVQFQDVQARAQDLYYKATGQSLPDPEILKANKKLIVANNAVLNKNEILSDTIQRNFDLSIKGEIKNDVNKNATLINRWLNPIYLALGDPAVNQALVSNGTISQEFANLISIRNSQGTTVADKEMADELIKFGTSVEAQKAVAERLLAEAKNIHGALVDQNKTLWEKIDPLQTQSENPNRGESVGIQGKSGVADKVTASLSAGKTPTEIIDAASKYNSDIAAKITEMRKYYNDQEIVNFLAQ